MQIQLDEQEIKLFKRFIESQSIKPSQWAENFRYVSLGAHVGRWKNEISPHLVKVMDTWAEPYVREMVILKSPQSGGTEVMLNCIAWAMDNDNAPIMIVFPTLETGRKMMKDRIIPMVRMSERLSGLIENFSEEITRYRIKLKTGTRLYIAWANSATMLASFPVKYLFFDELDKYPLSVNREADPVSLGEKRVITFKRSYKIMKVSTPTSEENYIWKAWENCEVQFEYYVKCPYCESEQTMGIDNLIYPQNINENSLKKGQGVYYKCGHCGKLWTDWDRKKAVENGCWKEIKGKMSDKPWSVGFHITSFIVLDISLGQIAYAYIKSRDDKMKLIDFYNAYLALPYAEGNENVIITAEQLYERRHNYIPKLNSEEGFEVPSGVLILTCAVDVQQSPSRLEYEIVGWGEGYQSWGIKHGIIIGDVTRDTVWNDLKRILEKDYKHESGINMKIAITFIDSGWLTDKVYDFCLRFRGKRVFPVKGLSGVYGKPLVSYGQGKLNKKTKIGVYMINTDLAKDIIYEWLNVEQQGEAGYMHYHEGYTFEYFRQLLSEVRIKKFDNAGRVYYIWQKRIRGGRSEALDLRVYNLAAIHALNVDFKKLRETVNKQIKIGLNENKTILNQTEPKRKKLNKKLLTNWIYSW